VPAELARWAARSAWWCAAGMGEAGKQFRRVNGHMHLRALRDTLEKITQPVGATGHTDTVSAA
jgi:putative transposase